MSDFRLLKNELLRLDREKHNLCFLTLCRDIGIIPKFLISRSKFLSKFHTNWKFQFEMKCLKSVIRSKHALIHAISKKIYGVRNDGLYNTFARYAVNGVYDRAMFVIEEYRHCQQIELDKRLEQKIQHLSSGLKSFSKSSNSVNFVNLSNHQFTDQQLNVLQKGPKFIFPSLVKPVDYIPQLEDVVKQVAPNKREELRCQLFLSYSKFLKSFRYSRDDLHTIKALKSIPDIVFLNTDKSNRIAVMNKSDYIQKMDDTIATLHCDSITTDPLSSYMYQSAKVAKNLQLSELPDHVKKLAKVNHLGSIPKMFSAVKDHKDNFPLRPIVMKCSAPSYYIEKALVCILKELLPPSIYVLSSTAEFINRIENTTLPQNFFMFSMDVISLFPSINMHKARDQVSSIIDNHPTFPKNLKIHIISAINLIIKNNYFVFNDKIYLQKLGAPMGSPISGIMAEFILRPLEESFLQQCPIKPCCWLRFVDDVFGIWPTSGPTSHDSFVDFFNLLNSQDNDIQFTMEKENNHQLPFLDVLLYHNDNSISRTVYRKPKVSRCTIPKSAIAPMTYKQSAYRSYIRRAMNVCTSDYIHQELDIIRSIAIDNGFSISFVNNIIKDLSRPRQHPPPSNSDIKRVSITYQSGLHEKLARIVKPHNIHLVARTNSKLSTKLHTNFDPLPKFSLPGVYEIPLLHPDNSISFYIGQTSRKLSVRINEHRNDLKNAKAYSALFKAFLKDPSVKICFDDAKIIAPFSSTSRTILRESLEIFIRGSLACNEQDSLSIPKVWLTLLQQ